MTDPERIVLPPPIHMEYILALFGTPRRRFDELYPRNHPQQPGYVPIVDARWIPVEVTPGHRHGFETGCLHCNRDLTAEEQWTRAKWTHRKNAGAKVDYSYIPLPPATRAAAKAKIVAYWIGQCHSCGIVFWDADDGRDMEPCTCRH